MNHYFQIKASYVVPFFVCFGFSTCLNSTSKTKADSDLSVPDVCPLPTIPVFPQVTALFSFKLFETVTEDKWQTKSSWEYIRLNLYSDDSNM